jgi:hypothetical protein
MRNIRTCVAIAALMIAAPAGAETPLTCLQAVRALADIAKTDSDRSGDINDCSPDAVIGAKVSLMAIAGFARDTEAICAKELGK